MDKIISHWQNPKGQCWKFEVTTSDIDLWCSTKICPWANSVYSIYLSTRFHLHQTSHHLPLVHRWSTNIPVNILVKTGDKENCIKELETCIVEIREWMTANILKLNDDQTEFIIFGTKQQLARIEEVFIAISSIQVQLVDQVRYLGYYMDQLLKNSPHINKLVSNLHLQLKNIHRIHSKLDQKSTKTII